MKALENPQYSPAEEKGVLCPTGNLADTFPCQVLDLCGNFLVSECSGP